MALEGAAIEGPAGRAIKRPRPFGAIVVAAVGFTVVSLVLPAIKEQVDLRAGVTARDARPSVERLEFRDLNGGSWRLADQRGSVVAVNFWATWCGPCREEIPSLTRVLGDFEPRGFRIVGVSMDDGGDRAEKVRAFLKESKIRYPIAFPAGGVSQLSQGMDGLPTTLLFDRQGRVAKTYVGEVRQRVLRRDVEELLREQ